MSHLDLDSLTPEDLVARYVVECRGSGHFLPYQDHEVVVEWLAAAGGDPDLLLVVLAEVLPDFFHGPKAPDRPRSLRSARRGVMRRLKDHAMRQADPHRSPDP